MRRKKSLLFFLCCLFFGLNNLFSQKNELDISAQFSWKNDSTIKLSLMNINMGAPYLIKLKVNQLSSNNSTELFAKDTFLIKKGINNKNFYITINKKIIQEGDSILNFEVVRTKLNNINDSNLSQHRLVIPKVQKISIELNDSTLRFKNIVDTNIRLKVKSSTIDSLMFTEEFLFNPAIDSNLKVKELIPSKPLTNRVLYLNFTDLSNDVLYEDTLYYIDGVFKEVYSEDEIKTNPPKPAPKSKIASIKGTTTLESNFFSETPMHSNNAQYPYTAIYSHNELDLMGLPFIVKAHHSTNSNLSPNFRNFFSFEFDINQYRNRMQNKLKEEAENKQYSLNEVNFDISENTKAIERLQKIQNTMINYPSEELFIDSLITEDIKIEQLSKRNDSLFNLDSLSGSNLDLSKNNLNSSDSSNSTPGIDSNLNQANINKVKELIQSLKQSNQKKQEYLNYIKQNPLSTDLNELSPTNLYQKFSSNNPASVFLRFEKFQLGNFYEYAGRYSIRDVEMKGVNTAFLLNPNNRIGMLYGKINDFQSIFLDLAPSNKRVTSAYFSNQTHSFFQPTVRLTEYKDIAINEELSSISPNYFLTSLNARGELSHLFYYDLEINQSHENLTFEESRTENFSKTAAYYGSLNFMPVDFLDLSLEYEQVGSDFNSDGVYFLIRNQQVYTFGYKLRLFKNKVYLKNNYSVINRNFEQKELTNQTKKLFFDVGTKFKRIPNFQFTYSPITVDIVNKIDTSFSGIDANTSVFLARMFYFKKVKKTIYNTALIYSELRNNFSDDFTTQKGFQHFLSISNENMSFSFTSSYFDIFKSIRFISSSYSQQINDKLSGTLNIAKNFANDFYSEILRCGFNYQLIKNLNIGAGGIFLVQYSSKINSGGSFSLKLSY